MSAKFLAVNVSEQISIGKLLFDSFLQFFSYSAKLAFN